MTSNERFAGKAALITGAGSGIGRAVARQLSEGGASVVGVDINPDGLAETGQQVPGPFTPIVADLRDPAAGADIVGQSLDVLGQLDILGNIAGISRAEHFTQVSVEDYRQMMAINVDGCFFTTQAAIPHLIETHGTVISIASTAALIGQAYTVTYCMSKAAVTLMTKALAMEFMKTGVRINAIAPGGIRTPLTASFRTPEGMDQDLAGRYHPFRGVGEVDDVAGLFAYLASEEARGIHGAVISVDNGLTTG